MPREKTANGKIPLHQKRCQLGRLEWGEGHFCDQPSVAEIAGVRICADHLHRLQEIADDAGRPFEVAA